MFDKLSCPGKGVEAILSTRFRLVNKLTETSKEVQTFGEKLSDMRAEGVLKGFKHKLLASPTHVDTNACVILDTRVKSIGCDPDLRNQKEIQEKLDDGRKLPRE